MPSRTCGNCGAPARPPFLAPPPETAPDLDGRPGEPARSTLHRWVQACPSCGAAAADLSILAPGSPVDDPDPFRRWARAAPADQAAEAWLWVAWAADDADDAAAARAARARSAAAWGDPAGAADALRLADVLRRSGDFAAAAAVLDGLDPADEQTAAILRFGQERVAAQDDGRHMLSSALRPPARRPHVSHVQPKRGGWWSRIVGR